MILYLERERVARKLSTCREHEAYANGVKGTYSECEGKEHLELSMGMGGLYTRENNRVCIRKPKNKREGPQEYNSDHNESVSKHYHKGHTMSGKSVSRSRNFNI